MRFNRRQPGRRDAGWRQIALTVVLVTWQDLAAGGDSLVALKPLFGGQAYHWFQELDYRRFGNDGLLIRVRAERVALVPRPVLFFSVNSYNQIVGKNARITVRMADGRERQPAVPGLTNPVLLDAMAPAGTADSRAKPFGTVTRVIIDDAEVNIVNSNGPVMVLQARHAESQAGKTGPRFINAQLRHVDTGRAIFSREMIWDEERDCFIVPGAYLERSKHGESRGAGISIDMGFTVRSL